MDELEVKDWAIFTKIIMQLKSKIDNNEGMDKYDLNDMHDRLVEDFSNYSEIMK